MEKMLRFFIAASALRVGSILAEREYHLISKQMNWTSAQSYCREHFTDLATVGNMEDVQNLNTEMAFDFLSMSNYESNQNFLWLGLYDDMNSWRWSLSDPGFYGDGEANFRNWLSGQPDNSGLSDLCAVTSAKGEWADASCDQSMEFVCIDVKGLNVNFVYIDKAMTWSKAQIHCRENYSDLASVRNKEDNNRITDVIPGRKTVWIGLFRDSWKWSDGSSLSFQYWSRNEPNGPTEMCGAAYIENSGKWVDANCVNQFQFICYDSKLSLKKVALKLKVSSPLDMSDLTVQEDIQRQLKQKLNEQKVFAEIKLNWGRQSDGKIFHEDEEGLKKTLETP
ncbi:Macrophage mannose receptor 1 [Oryzias melastigma]|uniref:Macrophage mannose receptor 1 n=1 Tax=Oryzias melastigma TaxID=30732 RepID=A0A834F8X8_ORYME|nr:Macrophage mannose receptor 1 [Oryzias melastigma]